MDKPIIDGQWDLPGFQQVREHLKSEDRSSYWIDEVVDTKKPLSCFLKEGKPWYRSDCPYYEGFWLQGGIGSVQCAKVPYLLPGLMHHTTCRKYPAECPFREGEEDPI